MTRVDFYLINETTSLGRHRFACRLTEKIYRKKHKLYIHCQDQQQAHQIDELLWTYQDQSFIPHNIYGEGPTPPPPIQVGFGVEPKEHRDILLNYSAEVPGFYSQFRRIIEIVSQDDAAKAASREHYKFYKQQGYDIQTHDLLTTT